MPGRSISRLLALAIGVAGLAACNQMPNPAAPGTEPNLAAPTPQVQSRPLDAGSASTAIGNGPNRIALILPLTQNGAPSQVGTSLRNAAAMAYAESGSSDLTIIVKDDRSNPDGAREATQAALGEGAQLILGPVFAADVREAAKVARAAGKPVIGFSTDSASASRGVYLLSFLVETYVDRIVDYASAQGKKSFGALVPENEYGTVALAAFQQAVARHGARVEAIERYKPGAAAEAVARIAGALPRIDALFVPEQADSMPALAQALAGSGIDSHKVQMLGTGVWNDPRVLKLPALQGAWFAAPESAGYSAFSDRYRAKYGSEPARIATLAYDAVSLAAALARTPNPDHFAEATLTSSSGFNGADGVFRFRPEGPNDRGLAVLRIDNGAASVVSPAPRSFANTPSQM